MTLLLIIPGRDNSGMVNRLAAVDPEVPIAVWPEVENPDAIRFAVTWYHHPGSLCGYANLSGISSLGAGMDHILEDPDLPQGIPLARVVDDQLVKEMREYLLLAVLHRHREWDAYKQQQRERSWVMRPAKPAPAIGILGLGQMGAAIAASFVHLNYPVLGWSRGPKSLQGVDCHHGDQGFAAVLQATDILICLLPLTRDTRNILDARCFSQMKRGSYLINVGRGDHLVEKDLLSALEEGQIGGACLDVFDREPLPEDHPFWDHPRITLTPHIASRTNPESVAELLIDNYHRACEGKPLRFAVDPHRGY